MTDCDWAEKISLLIDGELAAAEARAVEQHLGDCFACRLAREDFLLLRHQIGSYRPEVNLLAQRRTLDHILGSGPAAAARPLAKAADRRERRERAAGLFILPRFAPALVAASALVLVGLVVGLLMFRDRPTTQLAKDTRPDPARANASDRQTPAPTPAAVRPSAATTPTAAPQLAADNNGRLMQTAPPVIQTATPDERVGVGVRLRSQGGARETIRPGVAAGLEVAESADLPLVIPPRITVDSGADSGARAAADADAADAAVFNSAPRPEADPTSLSASRHAEQAQQLLRAFRNADAGAGADLAYERARSQELLYQNILLRREAASHGDIAVESVLGSLEPILLDIANLSDKPAGEDVRSINERMKKKDIVARLQIAARD